MAAVKKLINDPQTVVAESLEGFGAAHPDVVTIHSDPWFVARAGGASAGKVGLVSGGGSGHQAGTANSSVRLPWACPSS